MLFRSPKPQNPVDLFFMYLDLEVDLKCDGKNAEKDKATNGRMREWCTGEQVFAGAFNLYGIGAVLMESFRVSTGMMVQECLT